MDDKNRIQRYADCLEKTVRMDYEFLSAAAEDVHKKCHAAVVQKRFPVNVINYVRETYKEMRTRLAEINAIQQLFRGKYRKYVSRNPVRDKNILEMEFIAKSAISKFEAALKLARSKTRGKVERKSEQVNSEQWFRLRENQISLIKNLRLLNELDYEPFSGPAGSGRSGLSEEGRGKRAISSNRRCLTLFILKGDRSVIDGLEGRMRLREHDVLERYSNDELRGVITHLREFDIDEVRKIFQRFVGSPGYSGLKCILIGITNFKHLEDRIFAGLEASLKRMSPGEIMTHRIK